MITIAIVGILAAVAIPAYQDYSIRAKVSEPIALLSEGKTSISEYYTALGKLPTNAGQAGIRTDVDTDIVASLVWSAADKELQVKLKNIGGNTVTRNEFGMVISSTATGMPKWVCGAQFSEANAVEQNYLPASCRAELSDY